jgi:hypothetical protein
VPSASLLRDECECECRNCECPNDRSFATCRKEGQDIVVDLKMLVARSESKRKHLIGYDPVATVVELNGKLWSRPALGNAPSDDEDGNMKYEYFILYIFMIITYVH